MDYSNYRMRDEVEVSQVGNYFYLNWGRNHGGNDTLMNVTCQTCACAQLLSPVWLFAAPWTVTCQVPRSTGVGCYFLLQGIFPNQGSNCSLLHLLHWQMDSLPLAPLMKPYMSMQTKILGKNAFLKPRLKMNILKMANISSLYIIPLESMLSYSPVNTL